MMEIIHYMLRPHLLVQEGNSAVAEAFIASWLESTRAHNTGCLARGLDIETLIERGDPLFV